MIDGILREVRNSSPNLKNSIIKSLIVASRSVTVNLVTDKAFTEDDRKGALTVLRTAVPDFFSCAVEITKLTPDSAMIERKIAECINANFMTVASTLQEGDIRAEKTEDGFKYTVAVLPHLVSLNICPKITEFLKKNYCGEFEGSVISSARSAKDIEVEERPDEIEYEVPIRYFEIIDFKTIEGTKKQTLAIYMADLNHAANELVVCGQVEEIKERKYTRNDEEKTYLSLVISDGTATIYTTYFIRKRTYDKIKEIKVGDYIVCTGDNESYNGNLRFKTRLIDLGRPPKDFVPEKRESKPVPSYYHVVKPQPFSDIQQTDLFTDTSLPECLKANDFVVFDLETTGLNSSPVSGNMDKIIEIGAFKIKDGRISENFSTFINPERKLSDEIIHITGITEEMVKDAPTCEEALPDFFKFCSGSILVGHNLVGFDFKFVDYYCAKLGYIFDRKLIDTIPLSQELLFLSNYKLNTVADKFGITFNHHRATDDALATAKIFIELIKIKKSLPRLQ